MLVAAPDTSTRILDVAERLVQTRGYNAFSYADIAAALKVTKATLHYHFPTKAELGRRLIDRYHATFLDALRQIDEDCRDSRAKLKAYVDIYATVLDDNRMCLCGMLAADFATLPGPMRDAIRRFFDANETWLEKTLEQGRKAKELAFTSSPIEVAQVLVGALEGAMLLARSHGDAARFRSVACHLLADIGIKPGSTTAIGKKRQP